MDLIPVSIVTGFLGSGKTTLLNRLLSQPDMARTAVIVNEFGEIGLDHLLIASAEENMLLLDNGCLCCTAGGNGLKDVLADLVVRRARASVPPFERVVIETTGLADPAPILHTLMTDALARSQFSLAGVATTVDLALGESTLDLYAEARKQVAVADRLLLTKADLVDAAGHRQMMNRLSALNPTAEINMVDIDAVTPSLILAPAAPLALPEPGSDHHASCDDAACDHHHHHPVAEHTAGITTTSRVIDHPVSWAGLAAWSDLVREFLGDRLLRVKGIIAIQETGLPVVVHGVQHIFDAPRRLKGWPSDDQRSRLVCITRDVQAPLLERSFAALRLPPGAMRPRSIDDLTVG